MSYWPHGRPDIRLHPSRIARVMLWGVHFFALMVVLLSLWPAIVRFGLASLVLGHLGWRIHAAPEQRRVNRLHFRDLETDPDVIPGDGAGGWRLTDHSGRVFEAGLQPNSRVMPGVICLRFLLQLPGGRAEPLELVLFPDSMSASDWRRLKVFLRWFGEAGGEPKKEAL